MWRRLWMILALCLVLVAVDGREVGAAMGVDDFLFLCAEGTPEEVQAALADVTDVNTQVERHGNTALMVAARKNENPEVIRILLKAGADVNARKVDGGTALMWAARYNKNPKVISALIQAGADVNAKIDARSTFLMLVTMNNKNPPEVISALIKAEADVKDRGKNVVTALKLASDNAEVKEMLIRAGAKE